MIRRLAALLLAGAALAFPAAAQDHPEWTKPAQPFRIIGPIYSVGSEGLVVLLIHTAEGEILIDGGPPGYAPQIEANIRALGFRPQDVKILLNSHAHLDHSGGLAQLKADTGAELIASAGDKSALESGKYLGSEDNHALDSVPVQVDETIGDGGTISLGGVTLVAHLTPGHTRGCTSWTIPVRDGGARHTAIFFCSATVAANHLAPKEQYPGIIDDYRATFKKARRIEADVYLAPHVEFFDFWGKRAKMTPGGPNPYVQPGEYLAAVDRFEADFEKELAKQQAAAKQRR